MTTCAYAACTAKATEHDDGWDFCAQHYREHRADLHGEPWPPLHPVNLRRFFTPPCGTASGARSHYRRGEKPCEACMEASRRARSPHNPDIRRGSWSRPVTS